MLGLETSFHEQAFRHTGGSMLASSIGWILVVSGAVTAVAGLTAFLFPGPLLRLGFRVEGGGGSIVFFVRHWGVLLFVMGALILDSAYVPAARAPVLTAASIEKVAIVLLIFFGPLKRTIPMTAIAIADGVFAILYVAYLAGL
jgi:hypothetical protein